MTTSADAGRRCWRLVRRCAMTPGCFAACCAGAGSGSMLIGLGFWWMGYPGVAAFAGLELLLIAISTLRYARHAADGEEIELAGGELRVRVWTAGNCTQHRFSTAFVRIDLDPRSGLVHCSEGRQRAVVGAQATYAARRQFVRELRSALAAARSFAHPPPVHPMPALAQSPAIPP